MQSKAMQKMKEISDRLFIATPHLYKDIGPENLLRPKFDEKAFEREISVQQQQNQQKISTANALKNYSAIKEELTPMEIQKNFQDYIKFFEEEKEVNSALKIEKDEKMKRFIKREQEYRKIIEDLTKELRPN